MAKTRRYWSRLPPELLSKIAASLDEITDRIRFGSVCKQWNCASKSRTVLSQPSFPWLLLPSSTVTSAGIHKFFSLSENKIYTLRLPETRRTAIYESSHGYLLTLDKFGMDKTVHLLNPITRHHSHLPPLPGTACYDYNVKRWRLVTQPQSTILILLVGLGPIYRIEKQQAGPNWGTWRVMIGIPRWSPIEFNFHKGCIFALDYWFWETLVMDFHSLEEVSTIPPAVSKFDSRLSLHYLVESSSGDELFMVIMDMSTPQFEVFRLGEQKWVEVRSIGEDMMFVDYRKAMALSARDFSGRRGNCIYFVNIGRPNAPGLYDIESGRVEDFPHCWDDGVSRSKSPGWIMPSMLMGL